MSNQKNAKKPNSRSASKSIKHDLVEKKAVDYRSRQLNPGDLKNKEVVDNRSRQLNPLDPVYQKSRSKNK
jgi:hypothetical protein